MILHQYNCKNQGKEIISRIFTVLGFLYFQLNLAYFTIKMSYIHRSCFTLGFLAANFHKWVLSPMMRIIAKFGLVQEHVIFFAN